MLVWLLHSSPFVLQCPAGRKLPTVPKMWGWKTNLSLPKINSATGWTRVGTHVCVDFLVKDQAVRPVPSHFGLVLVLVLSKLYTNVWSVLPTCKGKALLILTDMPTSLFSKWRAVWHELSRFCYPEENLCRSNDHPLIWENSPFLQWWRPDIRQEVGKADDLGLLSSDCSSRTYSLSIPYYIGAESLHGHLFRHLIHSQGRMFYYMVLRLLFFKLWNTRKQAFLEPRSDFWIFIFLSSCPYQSVVVNIIFCLYPWLLVKVHVCLGTDKKRMYFLKDRISLYIPDRLGTLH